MGIKQSSASKFLNSLEAEKHRRGPATMIKLPISEMSSRYGTTRLSSGFTTSCCPNVKAKDALDQASTRGLCEVRHKHVRHPDAATAYITACITMQLSNLS